MKRNFHELPFLHNASDEAESQYRMLYAKTWKHEFDCGLTKDTIGFWEHVYNMDEFKALARYALTCLVIPSSNACVERIFSVMNSTKTKQRNRLGMPI